MLLLYSGIFMATVTDLSQEGSYCGLTYDKHQSTMYVDFDIERRLLDCYCTVSKLWQTKINHPIMILCLKLIYLTLVVG